MSLTRYSNPSPRHLQDEIKLVFEKFFNGETDI